MTEAPSIISICQDEIETIMPSESTEHLSILKTKPYHRSKNKELYPLPRNNNQSSFESVSLIKNNVFQFFGLFDYFQGISN
jgi:hypothetical protein